MSRVALVTGGSRGIGAAISKALKAAGYKVAANYAGNDEAAQKFKVLDATVWTPSLNAARERMFREIETHGLPVPTLVIWGNDDVAAPVRQGLAFWDGLTPRTPNAEFHLFNHARHYVFRDQPAKQVRKAESDEKRIGRNAGSERPGDDGVARVAQDARDERHPAHRDKRLHQIHPGIIAGAGRGLARNPLNRYN